jgi:DNA primase
MTEPSSIASDELPVRYHEALPERIRQYLKARGITDELIALQLLGWNGERITIPIFDRESRFAFFKLAKDPEDQREGPKMLATLGSSIELYGWERLRVRPPRIILCEGEFDRLVLEAHGFGAVTSTGGAGVFRPEWAESFREVPDVYICFDRDDMGQRGARRVAMMVPHAKIVKLPEEVGLGGDVTDFFVRLGRTCEDFLRLLEVAQPLEPTETQPGPKPVDRGPRPSPDPEVEALKSRVAIDILIGRYIRLWHNGQTYRARCPFHEDHSPSFVVYPGTRSFYCFGCGAHGDVLTFIMRAEGVGFREALNRLRELAAGHGSRT